jgi:hypothetical protein
VGFWQILNGDVSSGKDAEIFGGFQILPLLTYLRRIVILHLKPALFDYPRDSGTMFKGE